MFLYDGFYSPLTGPEGPPTKKPRKPADKGKSDEAAARNALLSGLAGGQDYPESETSPNEQADSLFSRF